MDDKAFLQNMNRLWEEPRLWISAYCIITWSVNMYKNSWKRLLSWRTRPAVIHGSREMVLTYAWGISPKEAGFIRMVFYSSAKHQGIALNDVLPGTSNSLQGVIMRFRKENKSQSQ